MIQESLNPLGEQNRLNMERAGTTSPNAELCSDSAPAWFCIRSHLKHEHIAAAHLRQIPHVQVFNPQIHLVRSTRRGPVRSTESLFPNYLFARFALDSTLEKVRYSPSIKMVVQFGGRMPSIPDNIIQELQRDIEALKSKVLTEAPLEGEEVEVAAGAFRGLKGSVVRVFPAKQRVQILLDVMGRATAAELNLGNVLFRKKDAANLVLSPTETRFRSPSCTAVQGEKLSSRHKQP